MLTAMQNRKYQKQKPTKLEAKASMHNRFDIYFGDKQVAYGESEFQKGMAENIVLDQMYTRLCGRSTYFVNIHFGTGTGTLSAARTSLFTHLGTKTAVNDAQSKALPTSWWRQKIVLNPEEYVGSALSEVGVAFGATSTNLVTHALIKDMNGNPITLTKTALDVVTIYATVYVTFSTSNESITFCNLESNNNPLINYLIGGTTWPSIYFKTGRSLKALNYSQQAPVGEAVGTSSILSWTSDVNNKKMFTNIYRFGIDSSNDHLTEIALSDIARLKLPSSIYSGLTLNGVTVGNGNGSQTLFLLPSRNLKTDSLVVYVDGIETAVTVKQHLSMSKMNDVIGAYGGGNTFSTKCKINRDSTCWVTRWVNETNQRWYGILTSDEVPKYGPYTSLDYDYRTIAISEGNPAYIVCSYNNSCYYEKIHNGSRSVLTMNTEVSSIFSNNAVKDISLSHDGNVLSFMNPSTSPYIFVFEKVGGVFIARPTISPSIGGAPAAMTMNRLGTKIYLYYSSSSTPRVFIYSWDGNNWVSEDTSGINIPNVSVNSAVGQIFVSNDEQTIFYSLLESQTSPIYCAKLINSTWEMRNITTLTRLASRQIAFSPDGLVICYSTDSNIYNIMEWDEDLGWILSAQQNPQYYVNEGYSIGKSQEGGRYYLIGGIAFYYTYQRIVFFEIQRNVPKINFPTPPANGAVITADYTVNGIHKTAQRVIDLYAEITFGEVT